MDESINGGRESGGREITEGTGREGEVRGVLERAREREERVGEVRGAWGERRGCGIRNIVLVLLQKRWSSFDVPWLASMVLTPTQVPRCVLDGTSQHTVAWHASLW